MSHNLKENQILNEILNPSTDEVYPYSLDQDQKPKNPNFRFFAVIDADGVEYAILLRTMPQYKGKVRRIQIGLKKNKYYKWDGFVIPAGKVKKLMTTFLAIMRDYFEGDFADSKKALGFALPLPNEFDKHQDLFVKAFKRTLRTYINVEGVAYTEFGGEESVPHVMSVKKGHKAATVFKQKAGAPIAILPVDMVDELQEPTKTSGKTTSDLDTPSGDVKTTTSLDQWNQPLSIENIGPVKKVKELGGSTGAKLYQNNNGEKFVLKKGNSKDHAFNEYVALNLYRMAGAAVPQALWDEQNETLITRFVENTKPFTYEYIDSLAQGYLLDVLFANWDVVGMSLDNVLVTPDGKAVRVDVGGALFYRAQGTPKGSNFSSTPSEDGIFPNKKPYNQANITQEMLSQQVETLESVFPKLISFLENDPLVQEHWSYSSNDLVELLKGRFAYLKNQYGSVKTTSSKETSKDVTPLNANITQFADNESILKAGSIIDELYEKFHGYSNSQLSELFEKTQPNSLPDMLTLKSPVQMWNENKFKGTSLEEDSSLVEFYPFVIFFIIASRNIPLKKFQNNELADYTLSNDAKVVWNARYKIKVLESDLLPLKVNNDPGSSIKQDDDDSESITTPKPSIEQHEDLEKQFKEIFDKKTNEEFFDTFFQKADDKPAHILRQIYKLMENPDVKQLVDNPEYTINAAKYLPMLTFFYVLSRFQVSGKIKGKDFYLTPNDVLTAVDYFWDYRYDYILTEEDVKKIIGDSSGSVSTTSSDDAPKNDLIASLSKAMREDSPAEFLKKTFESNVSKQVSEKGFHDVRMMSTIFDVYASKVPKDIPKPATKQYDIFYAVVTTCWYFGIGTYHWSTGKEMTENDAKNIYLSSSANIYELSVKHEDFEKIVNGVDVENPASSEVTDKIAAYFQVMKSDSPAEFLKKCFEEVPTEGKTSASMGYHTIKAISQVHDVYDSQLDFSYDPKDRYELFFAIYLACSYHDIQLYSWSNESPVTYDMIKNLYDQQIGLYSVGVKMSDVEAIKSGDSTAQSVSATTEIKDDFTLALINILKKDKPSNFIPKCFEANSPDSEGKFRDIKMLSSVFYVYSDDLIKSGVIASSTEEWNRTKIFQALHIACQHFGIDLYDWQVQSKLSQSDVDEVIKLDAGYYDIGILSEDYNQAKLGKLDSSQEPEKTQKQEPASVSEKALNSQKIQKIKETIEGVYTLSTFIEKFFHSFTQTGKKYHTLKALTDVLTFVNGKLEGKGETTIDSFGLLSAGILYYLFMNKVYVVTYNKTEKLTPDQMKQMILNIAKNPMGFYDHYDYGIHPSDYMFILNGGNTSTMNTTPTSAPAKPNVSNQVKLIVDYIKSLPLDEFIEDSFDATSNDQSVHELSAISATAIRIGQGLAKEGKLDSDKANDLSLGDVFKGILIALNDYGFSIFYSATGDLLDDGAINHLINKDYEDMSQLDVFYSIGIHEGEKESAVNGTWTPPAESSSTPDSEISKNLTPSASVYQSSLDVSFMNALINYFKTIPLGEFISHNFAATPKEGSDPLMHEFADFGKLVSEYLHEKKLGGDSSSVNGNIRVAIGKAIAYYGVANGLRFVKNDKVLSNTELLTELNKISDGVQKLVENNKKMLKIGLLHDDYVKFANASSVGATTDQEDFLINLPSGESGKSTETVIEPIAADVDKDGFDYGVFGLAREDLKNFVKYLWRVKTDPKKFAKSFFKSFPETSYNLHLIKDDLAMLKNQKLPSIFSSMSAYTLGFGLLIHAARLGFEINNPDGGNPDNVDTAKWIAMNSSTEHHGPYSSVFQSGIKHNSYVKLVGEGTPSDGTPWGVKFDSTIPHATAVGKEIVKFDDYKTETEISEKVQDIEFKFNISDSFMDIIKKTEVLKKRLIKKLHGGTIDSYQAQKFIKGMFNKVDKMSRSNLDQIKKANPDLILNYSDDSDTISAIHAYTGDTYTMINNALRSKSLERPSSVSDYDENKIVNLVTNINAGFEAKGFRFPRDYVLYRAQGLMQEDIDRLEEGGTFTMYGYTSASGSLDTPWGFMKTGESFSSQFFQTLFKGNPKSNVDTKLDHKILMSITRLDRTLSLIVEDVSSIPSEREVLINRNTVIRLKPGTEFELISSNSSETKNNYAAEFEVVADSSGLAESLVHLIEFKQFGKATLSQKLVLLMAKLQEISDEIGTEIDGTEEVYTPEKLAQSRLFLGMFNHD